MPSNRELPAAIKPPPVANPGSRFSLVALAFVAGAVGVEIWWMVHPAPALPTLSDWAVKAAGVAGVLIILPLALAAIVAVIGALRGERRPPLPSQLRARCWACGELRDGTGRCLLVHGPHPELPDTAWSELPRTPAWIALVLAPCGLGILLLVAVQIAFFAHGPIWLRILVGALALLKVALGVFLVVAAVRVSLEVWREGGLRCFGLHHRHESILIRGSASLLRGALSMNVEAERRHRYEDAPDPVMAPGPQPSPHRALVRILGVLHGRGRVRLTPLDTVAFRLDPEPSRKAHGDVAISCAPADDTSPPISEPQSDPTLVREVLSHVDGARARNIAARLRTDPSLQTTFERCADALATADLDERAAAFVAAALRDTAPSPAPYR